MVQYGSVKNSWKEFQLLLVTPPILHPQRIDARSHASIHYKGNKEFAAYLAKSAQRATVESNAFSSLDAFGSTAT